MTRGSRLGAAAAALVLALVARARGARGEPSEPDIPARLTLADALAIFRAHGLDLIIAEAQVAGAAGDARAAAAIPNPTVTGGASYSLFDGGAYAYPSHYGWSFGVGDSNAVEDTVSGKRALRERVAGAALAAARLQRADAQRTLELQVAQQYVQAAQATAALAFAREVAAAADRTFRLSQTRYAAGAISEVDLSRTETAKLEAEQAVDGATQALAQSRITLAFLLGRRHGDVAFTVDEGALRFATPPALAAASADGLIRQALASRADLQAQRHQRERAQAGLALARRLRFPDIGVGVEYQEQGAGSLVPTAAATMMGAITPPTLALTLTATLPLLYQQQGEIEKAAADARAQDAGVAKATAEVVADVQTAFAAYQTARGLIARMQGRLLDRARRARDLVELQYQKGAASLLEYLDAQRTYTAVNLEYLQDLAGYWSAVYQLEAAVAEEPQT